MSKAKINAHDAFTLLGGRKLYKNQLRDVLVNELDARKILCISDTTDVMVNAQEKTTSIAHYIEKAALGPQLEVIQTDFMDFRFLKDKERDNPESPKFGAHLPQQSQETRREYLKIDVTELEAGLSQVNDIDVILGRNCICGCEGNGTLCGGIGISIEAQQNYLETLIDLDPGLIVLSAAAATFFPESEEDCERQEQAQLLYKEAKENMLQVCINLNAKADSPYRFKLIEPDKNLKFLFAHPQNENGYMLVAYDTRKIIFKPTTMPLETKRQHEATQIARDNASSEALITQKIKMKDKKLSIENSLNEENRKLNSNEMKSSL